ncbi:MAG: hypothetical protein H7A49_10640 [Akkermansiaceae bacterium]|nr:hypothetical protein [Akkermansiaceae bacterium]MCP5547412.1 hypothetical protein [Akkermansiaceae bacterium]
MRVILCLAACWVCVSASWAEDATAVPAPRPDPARFAGEIETFAGQPPETGGIVFTGSSSIRLWERLREDFPGLPVVNRGFGGCVANDMVAYFDTIVARHEPKLLVLYVGTNDLHVPLSVEEAFADYRRFLGMVREKLPGTRIIVNSLKVAPSRMGQLPAVFEMNKRLRALAEGDGMIRFLDSTEYLMDQDGQPIKSLFRDDQLHLSPVGYAHWLILLDPVIREEWAKVDRPKAAESTATR